MSCSVSTSASRGTSGHAPPPNQPPATRTIEVGADIIETNSFGSTPLVLAEYGIADRAYELSFQAAAIARRAAAAASTPEWPRFVAGAVGPTTKLVSLGHISFAELLESFAVQIHGLIAGGADIIQIETGQDILGIKCAVLAARLGMERAGREVPIITQVTMETTGTMLVGTEIAAALPALEALDVDVIGLNCATGPDLMHEHVRYLGQNASRFVSVLPNAGLPRNVNGVATYDLTPESLADFQERFIRDYGVSLVGGCCGTTPEHIAAVRKRLQSGAAAARPRPDYDRAPGQVTSLYVPVLLTQDPGPLIIGERSNANGSKKFREQLLREDFEGLVEVGREQVAEGAHLIDVCVAYVGRDEVRDMREVLRRYTTQITLPLMIDTTQLDVLESALQQLGGRAVINSVNLEDGEEKADKKDRKGRRSEDKDGSKDGAKKGGKATISISVRPFAIVYVDNKKIGQTPVRDYALSSGSHTILLVNDAKGKREKITVKASSGEKLAPINKDWN